MLPSPGFAAGAWKEGLGASYPEVDVEVAGAAELAVADLEGDGHLVVAVQLLVEALAAVGGQLDVVGGGGPQQAGREEQLRCRGEEVHRERDGPGAAVVVLESNRAITRTGWRIHVGGGGWWVWADGIILVTCRARQEQSRSDVCAPVSLDQLAGALLGDTVIGLQRSFHSSVSTLSERRGRTERCSSDDKEGKR